MRLRLNDLEEARLDPSRFLKQAGAEAFYRLGKNRALQLAIYDYHRKQGDLVSALRYFERTYKRNFTVNDRLQPLSDMLRRYDNAFKASGLVAVDWQINVRIDASPDLVLTGEIPRVDLKGESAYAVWLFLFSHTNWSGELRMPLLQDYFARKMGVLEADVSVGTYRMDLALYEGRTYSKSAINSAKASVAALAERLANTT